MVRPVAETADDPIAVYSGAATARHVHAEEPMTYSGAITPRRPVYVDEPRAVHAEEPMTYSGAITPRRPVYADEPRAAYTGAAACYEQGALSARAWAPVMHPNVSTSSGPVRTIRVCARQ